MSRSIHAKHDDRPRGSRRQRYEEVARRAYQLWKERGSPDGKPEEDWFRAEATLSLEPRREQGGAT